MAPSYQSQSLDHLGLVAGMCEELGIGDVIDRAIAQDRTTRTVSLGHAGQAMILNGLGFVNQQLYLVPSFFQPKPTERLVGPGITAADLHDDVLGRGLEALYGYGVTPLDSLIATQAAPRLGLTAQFAPLDTTSVHVDGRYHSADAPDDRVVPITPGDSRDHRPDLHHVMLALSVEPQAGIPLLMPALHGNTHDCSEFGQVVTAPVQQLHAAHRRTSLVAESALYRADTLETLAHSGVPWITRVPAPLAEARAVLAQVDPHTLAALTEGYRFQEVTATYAGIAQRWVVVSSEARRTQARRAVDQQVRTRGDAELQVFKQWCRTAVACEPDARQALEHFRASLQATRLEGETIRAVPRDGTRGRPTPATAAAQIAYVIEGALASSLAYHQTLWDRHRCLILATNAQDATALPAQEVLRADTGQSRPARGCRLLKAPRVLASSLYLKKPERSMAWLMVMTICLLVYAALEYRIRQALQSQHETFPDRKGRPIQQPTARWVFHVFVGIPVLRGVGERPVVLNLNGQHQLLLKLLGPSDERLYA